MNRYVLLVSRLFLIGLIALFVIAAVLVGVGRQLVTHVDEFQPEISDYLSANTGLNVAFDSLAGEWQGLTPKMTLRGLRLTHPQVEQPFLTLNNSVLELNLGASLLRARPVIKLWLDGAGFDVLFADNHFSLANLPLSVPAETEPSQAPKDGPTLLDRIDALISQPHIQVTNSQISVQGFWQQHVSISDINLGVSRQGEKKHFWADLQLIQDGNAIRSRVAGDFSGRLSDQGSLFGHLYSRVSAPQLAPWMPLPVSELSAIEVTRASGDVELWGRIHEGRLQRVTTRLEVSDVVLTHQDKDWQPPSLKTVSGVAKWEGSWQSDWVVGLESLEVTGEDFVWHPQQLVLHSKKVSPRERRYVGRLDRATLSPWLRYYAAFLDPESKAYQTLSTLKPEAILSDLIFELDMKDARVQDYRLALTMSEFSMSPMKWIPGVNHVAARVLLGKSLSVIDLLGRDVDLDYPRLFRETLPIDEVKGALLIHNSESEWLLQSGLLEINDAELSVATLLSVSKDKLSDRMPYLRLQATLGELDAQHVYAHLPVGVIPDGVVGWLDQAIRSGTLLRSDLLFHGPTNLHELEPFQYVLGFTVDDVQLSYLEGWRPVDGVAADVRIYNGEVDAWALTGNYFGADVRHAHVGTHRISKGNMDLRVDAALSGPVDQALLILSDSPIQETTGPIMETLAVTGQGDMQVRVDVPFRQGERPKLGLQVQVDVTDALFKLQQPELIIDGLQGQVNFSLAEGLSSPGLTGRLLGGDIRATIASVPDGEGRETRVLAQGNTTLDVLKPWLKLPLLEPLDGPLDYSAEVAIRSTPEDELINRSRLTVRSQLQNVRAAYPYPLNKSAGEAVNFEFQTSFGGKRRLQTVRYGDLFDLQMVMADSGIVRGALALGERATLPEQPYFALSGHLDQLDVTAWADAWTGLSRDHTDATVQEHSAGLLSRVDHSQLHIDSLILGGRGDDQGRRLQGLDLSWQRQDGGVVIGVVSPDVSGNALIPFGYLAGDDYRTPKDPLKVTISRLRLPANTEGAQSEASVKQEMPSFDPRMLPPLDLTLQQLLLGESDYGSWRLRWSPVASGVRFDTLAFELKQVAFKGSGDWLWQGDHAETRIEGDAKADNVADILTAWGYAPSLTSEAARMSLRGQWRNAPYDFDLLTAEATFDLLLKDGRFRDVSSGAADKALGILNFDDWLSRMSLKIKDLESKEMPYREIRGEFQLAKQILTAKQLKLDSAAMKMTMDGDLNLKSRNIDANMNVVIPVTRNLVIPAAAVGGLPAAATVYVIEKVLGSQLDKLTTMKYRVEGPLDNPSVLLQESFNIIPKQIQESIVKEGGPANPEAPSGNAQPKPQDSEPMAVQTGAEDSAAEASVITAPDNVTDQAMTP